MKAAHRKSMFQIYFSNDWELFCADCLEFELTLTGAQDYVIPFFEKESGLVSGSVARISVSFLAEIVVDISEFSSPISATSGFGDRGRLRLRLPACLFEQTRCSKGPAKAVFSVQHRLLPE